MEAIGKCSLGFEAVQKVFESFFDDPSERGGGVCVNVGGETVVDLWAGTLDLEGKEPWKHNTLVNSYCAIKPVTAIAVLMQVEAGKLELDKPIAHYWPEFAQGAKERITLRQVLCHTSGIPALRLPSRTPVMHDWAQMADIVAAEPLWWEPGTELGYGASTYGWILGELIQRTDGRDSKTFIREQITQPHGLEVHAGVDPQHYSRIAHFEYAQGRIGDSYDQALRRAMKSEPEHVATLSFSNPSISPSLTSSPNWWGYHQPGVNSHSTASGLAGFYSALLAGKLIGPELFKEFTKEHSNNFDRSLLRPMRYGLGCMLEPAVNPDDIYCMAQSAFGHVGMGGPISFGDAERDISFAFVTNTMGGHVLSDPRIQKLSKAVYASL
ncbi:serine hydrolase [Pseudomonas helleri]|uniref:Serine hydrolase n=2 Tax=Pseudomonas TaxID=286 RepID=A0A6A7YKQ8_9PSED|nr:serine hydrolase domain-containing protein [Pseudomonas helleri]MQT33135.1 serine hydrolase [Pseudomonas helleri]MQT49952.1 serine hydrolase [Pseudomonas helleri]MQT92305.1 serine hydrolase [Pseudomonas helleri]